MLHYPAARIRRRTPLIADLAIPQALVAGSGAASRRRSGSPRSRAGLSGLPRPPRR